MSSHTGVPSKDELEAEVRGDQLTLARDLRERRLLLGWSQVELSRVSNVGRTVINQIEAGSWTDVDGPDPFVVMAAGRTPFRVEDLLALARLLGSFDERDM